MNDVIAKGYVERVALIEAESGKKVWIIPPSWGVSPKEAAENTSGVGLLGGL